jgi:hypothetical protein
VSLGYMLSRGVEMQRRQACRRKGAVSSRSAGASFFRLLASQAATMPLRCSSLAGCQWHTASHRQRRR